MRRRSFLGVARQKNIKGIAQKIPYEQITQSIKNGYAVQANAGYYKGNTRTGGHAVVICGTLFTDGSDGIVVYIDYIDPKYGDYHRCTYSSFCDGSFNGRKYDQTVYVA